MSHKSQRLSENEDDDEIFNRWKSFFFIRERSAFASIFMFIVVKRSFKENEITILHFSYSLFTSTLRRRRIFSILVFDRVNVFHLFPMKI